MIILNRKIKIVKSLLTALLLLLFFSSGSFSATSLPREDSFATNYSDLVASPPGAAEYFWNYFDGDNKIGVNASQALTNNSQLIMRNKGYGMYNNMDEYCSMYVDDVNGDFAVTVRINFMKNLSNSQTKAGIIARNDITDPKQGGLGSTGYVIMGLTPVISNADSTFSGDILFQWDGNGDGDLIESDKITATPTNDPPDIWLKLERNGNKYIGSYSYNSDLSDWVELGSYTFPATIPPGIPNPALPNAGQDVGLFVTSGKNAKAVAKFDDFKIEDPGATTFKHYPDLDGDTYVSSSNFIENTSATPPAAPAPGQYITYTDAEIALKADADPPQLDCNDNDPLIKPGVADGCDSIDNDCDTFTDEDGVTTDFFHDGDDDGYGDSTNVLNQCFQPADYVTNDQDCDDADANINPAEVDVCGDNIDQDCSGTDRACGTSEVCLEIADVPLSTQINQDLPLIMLLLDDSGSMGWDTSCPENNGRFNGSNNISSNLSRWKGQFYGHNKIYYNPAITYEFWPTYSNADPDEPRNHPVVTGSGSNFTSTSTTELSSTYTTIYGPRVTTSIKYAHWYMQKGSAVYLVVLDGTIKYYEATLSGTGDYATVTNLSNVASIPEEVDVDRSYAEERQNFANWYKYYRTRELAAKASLGTVINEASNVKIGIHTVNHSVKETVRDINDSANKAYILRSLYNVKASGGTPLRRALQDIGQYYHADDGDNGNLGDSPYALEEDGGSCQYAFVIVMTDGYYNGDDPNVGDADTNTDGNTDTVFDGGIYADTAKDVDGNDLDPVVNSLSDIAMYYFENDLSASLSNNIPIDDDLHAVIPQASHQHMITYTIAFGLTGTLDSEDPTYKNCGKEGGTCPDWVDPGNGDEEKIDDLWHTAINGRGDFLSAGNTEELTKALSELFTEIDDKTRSSAAVSLNTQKLESDTDLYQGSFNSEDWSGNLKAYDVDMTTAEVADDPSWEAKTYLNALTGTQWDTDREIVTFNGSTSKAFRLANLTATQQNDISPNSGTAQKILNYIRGDRSNEISEDGTTGTLRRRNSLLGDIVHSSPTYENGVVYVGANDGMLHAFKANGSADDGKELFAYVPAMVIENLKNYADENYSHNYFVDGTITTGIVEPDSVSSPGVFKTMLVGGLGKGGRGYYAMDISTPTTITETNLPTVWEYPSTTDDDMGFSYSIPTIIKSNLAGNKPVIIFGNGYDSQNGSAVLYILDIDGNMLAKIDTKVGNSTTLCNGLSTPAVVDINDDQAVDYVYAGDLQGNMWKFDLTATDKSNWEVSYTDGTNPKPLFQAMNNNGTPQPITGRPNVMYQCKSKELGAAGYIVVFGTGKYISFGDIPNTDIQTIYGIWDWANEWELNGVSASDKYFGSFETVSGTPSVRKLSNIEATSYFTDSNFPTGKHLTLLQQIEIADVDLDEENLDDGWGETTNYDIDWFSPTELMEIKEKAKADLDAGGSGDEEEYKGGFHVGWYFDLPINRERVIANTQIRDSKVIIVSMIPSNSTCSAGGSSVINIFSACNGGMLPDSYYGEGEHSRKGEDEIYYDPAIIPGDEFDTMIPDPDVAIKIKSSTRGLYYWRMFE